MSYYGLVTKLHDYHKDPNSNNLYLADCYGEGVIVGPNMTEGQLVLYLPSDGQIERWFGDKFKLFRKNEDGTEQGGYIENTRHIRAIKLRGNQSSGVVLPIDKIYLEFGNQGWNDGDKVNIINGKEFCRKYIPVSKNKTHGTPKTSYKGRKSAGIIYPEFSMHADTEQLAYNLDKFKPGDIINLSLKMHGTSSRHMKTYAEYPKGFWRRLFHMKPKRKEAYVCGSRRCVVTKNSTGYYGNDAFRFKHHKELESKIESEMEIFGEIVGYYGPNETDTIMPIADNKKLNDKEFLKQFGNKTVFSYGCKPGESELYVYRITANNGEKEFTPDEIKKWCKENGVKHVPYIETFVYTTPENLMARINDYFEDITDPVGKTHVKEGVVVRILNRPRWTAFKAKTYEFRVLEGLIKESNDTPDMEEAQEVIENS